MVLDSSLIVSIVEISDLSTVITQMVKVNVDLIVYA